MNKRNITRILISATALVSLTAGCGSSAKSQADKAMKDAGVEVGDSGKLPSNFPADVPTPKLKLETGVEAAGTFTLRYTSADPKADLAAYRDALKAAGYAITLEKDDLAGAGKNTTLMASKGTETVLAAAFAADAPGGGNYMGVVVTTTP